MDVKGEVLLQFFNKIKLRNGTKTFLEPNFSLFIVKIKKLGFSAPLIFFKDPSLIKYRYSRRKSELVRNAQSLLQHLKFF